MPTKKTAKQYVNPIIIIIPSQHGEDDDNNGGAENQPSETDESSQSTKPGNSTQQIKHQRKKRSDSQHDNEVKHFCLSVLWTYMNIVSFDFVLEKEFVFICF